MTNRPRRRFTVRRTGAATGGAGSVVNTGIMITVPAPPNGSRTTGPVVIGDVPQQPRGWQPRPDLLAILDDARPGSRMVVRAVTGMRGVGKTQLAAAYARSRIDDQWRLVTWINAETANALLAGLADTADALGLAPAEDPSARGRALRHWLEADGTDCLIVFDNATSAELLQPFLPVSGNARVIITSNQHSMSALGEPVEVQIFTEDEGLTYLAGRTRINDHAGASALGQELGWLPLALAQATAVITAQHLDYDTYLARLNGKAVANLLAPFDGGQYPRSVAAAILLSLDTVADETGACAAVMNLLAVLSPAGVRRTLVHVAAAPVGLGLDREEGEFSPEVTDEALGRLAAASLLTFSIDGNTIIAHRLVTRVIREHLSAAGNLTNVCLVVADCLMEHARSQHRTWHQDRGATRDLAGQLTALQQTMAACQNTDLLTVVMFGLSTYAGYFFGQLGDSATQAIAINQVLLADSQQFPEAFFPGTSIIRNNLALVYQSAGRTAEAAPMLEQALIERERLAGPDDPNTLVIRNNLAEAYRAAGRTAEAITLHEQTLADRQRILGTDDPDTLATRNNLAEAYRATGRIAEALGLLDQTYADSRRILGAEHPATLTSRTNLALAYLDAGRVTEATHLLEQTLGVRLRLIGPDHPDTLNAINNLAVAYSSADRTTDAIRLFEKSFTDHLRVLGPGHPHTLLSRLNLVQAYYRVEDFGQVLPQMTQKLEDLERALSPEHPIALLVRNDLAMICVALARWGEAIALLEQNLTILERTFQPEEPAVFAARSMLAAAYTHAGRMIDAIKLLEQSLDAHMRIHGSDHPDTVSARTELATAYLTAGHTNTAAAMKGHDGAADDGR